MRASPLARILFVAWVVLVAYASLFPLTGWRDAGLSPFAFLQAPWPRYVTAFDIVVNVAGYLPHGLLCVLAVYPALRGPAAVTIAAVSGLGMSLGLETAQAYLPARDASNLDVLWNALGALAGAAAGALLAPRLLERGRLRALRHALFRPDATADLALALLGLWLFMQLNPAMLLFGAGDLRDLLSTPLGPGQPAALFTTIEALTAGANLVAVALIVASIVQPGVKARTLVVALVGAALSVKTAAFAVLMHAEDVLAWLTPGARYGLIAGLALALALLRLGRTMRLALAAVLLMAATVLVNLAPPNPYLAATLSVWQQGHFLNFNGLSRLVTLAWPFAAIAWLIWAAARRERPAAT
ncbi:MAG: VanZ family protein [Proteobacteria bacterium]|nr:VanZ family protein [Pseudomonadota bacterium]